MVIESSDVKSAMAVLQRLHYLDSDIDFAIKKNLKTDIESLLKNYLGLSDEEIEDDYIWIYEECCDIFNRIVNTKLWKDLEGSVVNVSIISVHGDLLIEFE